MRDEFLLKDDDKEVESDFRVDEVLNTARRPGWIIEKDTSREQVGQRA